MQDVNMIGILNFRTFRDALFSDLSIMKQALACCQVTNPLLSFSGVEG
jgi:hypothetical protein